VFKVFVRQALGGIHVPHDLSGHGCHGRAQGSGLAGVVRDVFLPGIGGLLPPVHLGAIVVPLTKLLCKGAFKWSTVAEQAFRDLQTTLTQTSVL
jgi:hypothetical protein